MGLGYTRWGHLTVALCMPQGPGIKKMESDTSEDGTVGSTSRDTVRNKDSNQLTLLFHLTSFTWAAAGRCPPLPAMVGETFSLC